MNELIEITRAETTYAEQNWRQSAGGRVVTYDMMLEMPRSPKVVALERNAEIVFEEKRYIVNHKETVGKASPEMVRLALSRAGGAAQPRRGRGGRPILPASSAGNAPPFTSHGAVASTAS